MVDSTVQPFEFKGNPVATVTLENGDILFCAKHVATALGYANTNDAIKKHCKGIANRYPLETADKAIRNWGEMCDEYMQEKQRIKRQYELLSAAVEEELAR